MWYVYILVKLCYLASPPPFFSTCGNTDLWYSAGSSIVTVFFLQSCQVFLCNQPTSIYQTVTQREREGGREGGRESGKGREGERERGRKGERERNGKRERDERLTRLVC